MRIGIDATALPPQPVGAGIYIIQLIRALSNLETDDEFVVFAQKRGFDTIGVPASDRLKWVLLPDRNPASRLVWEQFAFPGLVRRHHLDVLHSPHYTRPLWLPCKSVVTFHDMTFFLFPELHTRSKRVFFPLAIRASAWKADALIADSESTRQDAIRILSIKPEKISTVHLGVDLDFKLLGDRKLLDSARRKYDLPERYVLYVGLVEPRKNLFGLINAFRNIVDKGIDFHLVVAGRIGWMSAEVFRQVKNLGLDERVQFTGYVPREDLPLVYNLACLFVYPTRYEGFGLPVLEALASGIPVVTTDVSSLPEIVGDAGLLVPPDDETALADAMNRILKNPELRTELADRGIERAKSFTWERTAANTLQVYRSVCKTN